MEAGGHVEGNGMSDRSLMLFAGNANRPLAQEIANYLKVPLGQAVIGLFTHTGDSPAAVARFFLERGLDAYAATVGENLGAPDERVTHWPDLEALARQRFGPLNYLVLRRTGSAVLHTEVERLRALVPGVPDEAFARPEEGREVMTRQEVRAVVLARLMQLTAPGDVAWDVGAGLGTVSVELAVLRPALTITWAGMSRQETMISSAMVSRPGA